MKSLITGILLGFAAFNCLNSVFAQTIAYELPSSLYPFSFEDNGTDETDFFLLTPLKLYTQSGAPGFKNPRPVIINGNGELVWFSGENYTNCLDFKYYPEHDIYSYTFVEQGIPHTILLDSYLAIIDTISAINGIADVHDIQRAENGNWLLAMVYSDTVDLSAETFGGVQGSSTTILTGFGVQEIDASGTVVFEWNSNDYIPATETYDFYGYDPNDFDYCHGNAIEEDSDGHLLLSFRHLNAIYKINRTTGNIIWRLGGQSSDFTFVNDDGFSGQHDIRRLPSGNYSLFDNANMAPPPRISRGLEYVLDTINWTATLVDSVEHDPTFFARAMGNYQKETNGNSTIGYGLIFRPNPTATYFDAQKNPLAQIYYSDSVVTYRCQHSNDVALQQPEITCSWNGNNWLLEASLPAQEYLWSTDATSSSIVITEAGTYQLWVPYGSGFAGSLPFVVTDPNDPCGTAGITENSMNSTQELYVLYDLLGQTVLFPQPNQIYLKVYSSGKTEKCIIVAAE